MHATTEIIKGTGWETSFGVGFPNQHPGGGTNFPKSKVSVPTRTGTFEVPMSQKNQHNVSS